MKILSSGRFWGSRTNTGDDTRQHIIKLLRFSDLPIRTIARRFGLSVDTVSAINVSQSIRPKGFRPEASY
jgi:hypothetical protein